MKPAIPKNSYRLAAFLLVFSAIPLLGQESRRPKLVVTDNNGTVTTLQPTAGRNDGTDDGGATAGKDGMAWGGCDYRGNNFFNYGASYGVNAMCSDCNKCTGIAYFQFSLAGLPTVIRSAEIQFDMAVQHWACGWPWASDPIFALRQVTSDWNEMTLSWNVQPTYDAPVLATQTVTGVAGVPSLDVTKWVSFDITALYRAWVNGVPNYGVRLSHENGFCMNCDQVVIYASDDGVTQLTYTGPNSGDSGVAVTLSARLADVGMGTVVAGKQVSFQIGTQSCTGTTDSNGVAACAVTPSFGAGTPIAVSFAGDARYQASSTTAQFTINGGGGDQTPPVITPTVTGTHGANGWFVGDVTVTWKVNDPESSIKSSSGCDPAQLSASASLTCTAVNGAGLPASFPLNIRIDKTAPVISAPVIKGALGVNGWYTSDVTVSWSVSDAESAIVTPVCTATVSGDSAGATVTCDATNGAGLSSSSSVTIRIDKSQPVLAGMPTASCSLWPPNKKMVQVATITATAGLASFSPASRTPATPSNGPSGLASFDVTAVSNEPADGGPDIVISGSGLQPRTVQLRADRLGNGTGRVYTITATATSGAGVVSTSTATCTVPHDQGK